MYQFDTAVNTAHSTIITCMIGGEIGGMPVNNDEIRGVTIPTITAKYIGRKKADAAIGKSIGRKISPIFNP